MAGFCLMLLATELRSRAKFQLRALGSMARPKGLRSATEYNRRCIVCSASLPLLARVASPAGRPTAALSTRCSRRRSDTLQSTRTRSPPSARTHRTQGQAPVCRLRKHVRRAPWAVMKEASSEQRNAIKLATSCGSPSRPRAWRAESVALSSGLAWSPAVNPVLMNPGPAHHKRS